MYVTFNFLSDKVTATHEFDYRVIQTRSDNGKVIGGELYHIIKHDRTRFLADAGSNQNIGRGDVATLTATEFLPAKTSARQYADRSD